MRGQRAHQQRDRADQRERSDSVDEVAERAIERTFANPMANHRRDEQDDDNGWQQPNRAKNQVSGQREINCADREKRQQRLPARFRFINMTMWIAHTRRENRC
jgi:hypothetical protein